MRRKIAAGNWKMNGTREALAELRDLKAACPAPSVDVLICPPAPLLAAAADTGVPVGGQDCHPADSGAHTGDISAPMLRDAGATHVILGHSERRADHGETSALVRDKVIAARKAGLIPIVCAGENLDQRRAGDAVAVVVDQVAQSLPDDSDGSVIVAYEPIWAIGTGETATTDDIANMHSALRAALVERFGEAGAQIRLLYGGSVKPSNAADIFTVADVDGALVGGASLKASDFSAIISALEGA